MSICETCENAGSRACYQGVCTTVMREYPSAATRKHINHMQYTPNGESS